jgi:hypothetical protein
MRTGVRSAVLIAFSVACGYAKLILFPYLFFVELFTMAVFLSGMVAGAAWGAWIGGVSRLVFSVANPLGPPHPWILLAQVVAGALVGALGGAAGSWLFLPRGRASVHGAGRTALLLASGVVATLLYDLLTNLAQGIVFGSIPATLVLGAVPAAQHIASNAAIFAVVGSLALPWLARHPAVTSRGSRRLVAAVLTCLALGASRAAAAPSGPATAPSDSVVAPFGSTAAPVDSILMPPPKRVSAPGPMAVPDTVPATNPSAIDFDAQRKRGEVSFDSALLGRRVALYSPIPLYGAPQGSLMAPDAGSPLRPDHPGVVGDVATDRTLYDTGGYGLGVPDLAIGLDDPRGDNVDPLDLTSLAYDPVPAGFSRPGELLAQPQATRADRGALPDGSPRIKRAKSALYYGNGYGGETEVAARFVFPNLGKGISLGYARHESNGTGPLAHALTKRWTGAVALPRLLAHAFWFEGQAEERTIEDEVVRVIPITSEIETVTGSAQARLNDLSLHARAAGPGWESGWVLRSGLAKRSQVAPDSARSQWRFPEWSLAWSASKETAPGWTATLDAFGSVRDVQLNVGAYGLVDTRRYAARVAAGIRRDLGDSSGASVQVAPDFRETDSPLLDARASYWRQGVRGSVRIDLESAHERPSWVDLLTPAATVYVPSATSVTVFRYDVSGDPALGARRLDGILGSAAFQAAKSLAVAGTASLRYVHDDFGWNVSTPTAVDTVALVDQATMRGSGWVSHGSLSVTLHSGPITVRTLGWARGGASGLTPQAGSPPRYGAEGAADLRGVFFDGDVAFTLGVRGHAWGPRHGAIDVPGNASWDLALRADFGAAAAFAEYLNVFGREVASGIYGLYGDGTVEMPTSAFHFGVVWYLFA